MNNEDTKLTDITKFGTGEDTVQKYVTGRSSVNANAGYIIIDGYEVFRGSRNSDYLPIHKLVAVAEYGFDTVVDKHVHHKNGVRWDNRPGNLEPVDPAQHTSDHFANTPLQKRIEYATEWKLSETLRECGYTEAADKVHNTASD